MAVICKKDPRRIRELKRKYGPYERHTSFPEGPMPISLVFYLYNNYIKSICVEFEFISLTDLKYPYPIVDTPTVIVKAKVSQMGMPRDEIWIIRKELLRYMKEHAPGLIPVIEIT